MELLSVEHIAVLVATATVAAVSVWAGRTHPGPWIVACSRALAVVLLGAYLTEHAAALADGSWSPRRYLPLHLTDAVTIVAAMALWQPRPLLFELTWFWALSASLQAVLTPSLDHGFPSVYFWTFFLTHSGAVVAAVFLAFGRRLVARPGAVRRTFAATAGVAAVAGLGNLLTGGNYMFLRRKPSSSSLLDVMGPWPWYILSAAALGLLLFLALDLPFRAHRRPARRA